MLAAFSKGLALLHLMLFCDSWTGSGGTGSEGTGSDGSGSDGVGSGEMLQASIDRLTGL